jgi:predicted Zn-dependent protease
VNSTERVSGSRLASVEEVLAAITTGGQGKDLVGIFGQGPIYRGFANSFGQRNWFATHSFNFDWCFYLRADKAVKTSFAGFQWDTTARHEKMAGAARQLELLGQEPKTISPGKYRVYLSPVAVSEIGGILSWGGFGLKAHRSKISSLIRMSENGDTLHPSVSISENTAEGIAPNFDGKGFIKPDRVLLIEKGAFRDPLVSARSAKEFGVPANGAEAHEGPRSLDITAGGLSSADVLAQLGTGAYINNLHYLNYSDRPACRITGMTRFATFWVENGKMVAPLNVMRFDESAYRVLGENLVGLTREREMIFASDTYGGRSCESTRVPGALVKDFAFTL